MSSFLQKATVNYRPTSYTPVTFVPSIKDIPPLDDNNNSNHLERYPYRQQEHVGLSDARITTTMQTPLTQKQFSNNDVFNQTYTPPFEKESISLPSSYPSSTQNITSMSSPGLSTPTSITSNISSKSFPNSYESKTPGSEDEDDDAGLSPFRTFLLILILIFLFVWCLKYCLTSFCNKDLINLF